MRVTQENIIYLSRFLSHIKRKSACTSSCNGCIWRDKERNLCCYNDIEGVITDLLKQAKKQLKEKEKIYHGKNDYPHI